MTRQGELQRHRLVAQRGRVEEPVAHAKRQHTLHVFFHQYPAGRPSGGGTASGCARRLPRVTSPTGFTPSPVKIVKRQENRMTKKHEFKLGVVSGRSARGKASTNTESQAQFFARRSWRLALRKKLVRGCPAG